MNKNELIELVASYADKVFFYCIKRCKTRMDAEDLSQTILLECLENINKGTVINNFDYYIWGICRNQYNMYLRKKYKNDLELTDNIDKCDESKSVLEELIEDEKIKKINQSIKLLSIDYNKILYAYYIEDKTLNYISNELSLPLGTVKRKLFETRNKLKEYLDMEKLNGRKAYIPKEFEQTYILDKVGSHNPDDEVKTLIHRNLLFHSYDNPCTIEDYALELGISRPYIEEIVSRLTEVTLLKKIDDNRYITDFAFLTKETHQEIVDIKEKYWPKLYEEIKKYLVDNIDKYKNMMKHSNISKEKLMWSFALYCVTFLEWRVFHQYEHTLRPGKGRWDFSMREKYYNPKEVSEIGYTGFNGVGYCGWAYNTDNEPEILKEEMCLNGNEAWQGIYEFIRNLDENSCYDKDDKVMKELVTLLLKEKAIEVNDNKVSIKLPCIKMEDLEIINQELKNLKDVLIIMENLKKEIKEVLERNIPSYIYMQMDYLISEVSELKGLLINSLTKDNLLDYELDDGFFFYNGIFVYQ